MAKLTETLSTLSDVIRQLKAETANTINEMRHRNPDVKLIGNDEPRAFVVSSKSVFESCVLDPFYYDFDAQYDAVLSKLEKQGLDAFVNTVTEIVKTKKLNGRRFHPEVIKRLATLIE